MYIFHIVFEKGIEIIRTEKGFWIYKSVRGNQITTDPEEVQKKYGVRPVLMTGRMATNFYRTVLLSDKGNNIGKIQVSLAKSIPSQSEFYRINLKYVLDSIHHFCERLIEAYTHICSTFVKAPFPDNFRDDKVVLGYQAEPYYEFDALVTQVIRFYEITRYIVWKKFGNSNKSMPSSLEKTLSLCTGLPSTLLKRINFSLTTYKEKAKKYRDCIIHYVPVSPYLPYAIMTQLEEGAWGTSLLLPDNPEAKSQKKFRFDSHLDLLTYAWELTNEIGEIAQVIIREVPEK